MRLLFLLLMILAAPSALAQNTTLGTGQNTGTLSGTVTDSTSGATLPGATVRLPEIQRGAATDIDGRYTFLGVPAGVYHVEVSFVGFASKTISDVRITRDRRTWADVTLSESENTGEFAGHGWVPPQAPPPPASWRRDDGPPVTVPTAIRGTVTSLDGAPLVGAVVESLSGVTGTVTGTGGGYRIADADGLRTGWLRLRVSFPGFVPQVLYLALTPGQERRVDVALAPDPDAVPLTVCCDSDARRRLSGVVVDADGAAVPGVYVSLPEVGRTVRTDAAGAFAADGVPDGEVLLHAYRPPVWDLGDRSRAVATARRIVRSDAPVRLVLDDGVPLDAARQPEWSGQVQGIVRSAETGRGVPGARVLAHQLSGSGYPSPVDAAGAFAWERVPPGRHAIRVWARGYAIATDTLDVLADGLSAADLTLRPVAQAGACVSGAGALTATVTDADGRPEVRARVRVLGAPRGLPAETGNDGLVTGLPAGRYAVRVGGSGDAYRTVRDVDIACDRITHLDVRLPRAQPPAPLAPFSSRERLGIPDDRYLDILGHVLDAGTGEVISGARLAPSAESFVYSGFGGAYHARLLRGTDTFIVSADGYRTMVLSGVAGTRLDVPMERGAARDTVRVRLTGSSVLTGRVTEPNGQPAADVFISADTVSTFTDADGRYRLVGVRPGPHQLRADSGRHRTFHRVSVGPGASAEIEPIRLGAN